VCVGVLVSLLHSQLRACSVHGGTGGAGQVSLVGVYRVRCMLAVFLLLVRRFAGMVEEEAR